jgi:hypothetical protein
MSTLTKTLLAVTATMLLGGAAYVAAAPADRTPQSTVPAADVKGPCDEAEHAADPRCAATQVPEDNANHVEHRDRNRADHQQVADDDNQAEDVGDDNPGEAERHDNRGPGSLNSGPGDARDRGDGVVVEDNSGPGSEDSGQSGSGHSGSGDSGSDDSGSGGSGRD